MAKDAENSDLRVIARLQALAVIEGKNQTEAIRLLGRAGMARGEIAQVCGTSVEVVSVRLAEAKRKKRV
jgi:DNA-directed RNA polymerase specialized sigma24 family protein